MGFFKKDKDKSASHGITGAFSELREAERLLHGMQGGGAAAGEQFAASMAGDQPIDRDKAVAARARVVAYEGHDGMEAHGATRQPFREHAIYVVEVHPDAEPAFRTEAKGWVHVSLRPAENDVVNVIYDRDTRRAQLDLAGDSRFDWEQQAAAQQAEGTARRDALLNAPVSQDPLP